MRSGGRRSKSLALRNRLARRMADEQPTGADAIQDKPATEAAAVPAPETPDGIKDGADRTVECLSGERYPAPRSSVATALMAVTGVLLLFRGVRLVAKVVLKYRQPTEVRVSADSIRVFSRTEMLGRLLREQAIVIPKVGLVRAVRETRYPRLGMYAGLIALALGSYLGVSLVVDGLRAASVSMFGMGALVALFGLGIDFALASLVPGSSGRCRLILVPRRGALLCIGSVDPALADRLLSRLNGP
jgi:hypothetical protein